LSNINTIIPLRTFEFLTGKLQNSIESFSNFSGVILFNKLENEKGKGKDIKIEKEKKKKLK
jgi:hypothetical protein